MKNIILILRTNYILLCCLSTICQALLHARCHRTAFKPTTKLRTWRLHTNDDKDYYDEIRLQTVVSRRSQLRTILQSFTVSFFGSTIPSPARAGSSSSTSSSTSDSLKPLAISNSKMTPANRRIGGLAAKIRGISVVMDELQRDLMQERWDLVVAYPAQLRSFVPVLTTYTDSAFPSDAPTDKGLRVALRYEVGRFFASVERLKQACSRKTLDEAYIAYSEMSLHFDRYLRVGGLYTYYDDTISNEPYFQGISDSALVYANPQKDPPLVRDLIVLIAGPDKGKTGIVIGLYKDGSNKTVVKLDRYKGLREIRVVSNTWVAKRLGEQLPDDVFLITRKKVS